MDNNLIQEDYTYSPFQSDVKECPVCQICSFAHHHKKGTLPKDFTVPEPTITGCPAHTEKHPICILCQNFYQSEKVKKFEDMWNEMLAKEPSDSNSRRFNLVTMDMLNLHALELSQLREEVRKMKESIATLERILNSHGIYE